MQETLQRLGLSLAGELLFEDICFLSLYFGSSLRGGVIVLLFLQTLSGEFGQSGRRAPFFLAPDTGAAAEAGTARDDRLGMDRTCALFGLVIRTDF